MKRFSLLLITLLITLSVLALLAGCTHDERFGRLLVTTDLTPSYVVALETQKDVVGFYELTRAPVGADKTLEFVRLPPGEYRLEVFNAANQSVFISESFGVTTSGDSHYALTTGLPAQ
jgi:hypothetical protein